jgi:V8-like Glu-specific endopeptidase
MIRKPRLAGALSAVFAAFLIFPTSVVSPATAGSAARGDSPEPTTPTARLSVGQTVTQAEANAAIRFWTRERMASAKPVNMRSLPGQNGNAARRPANATVDHGFLGGKAPASAGVVPSAKPTSERYWPGSNLNAPARNIGKLFFETWVPEQKKYGNAVCSATVIAAENRSTVWTAGHCVFNTFSNVWNRNYIFCPGYRDINGVPGEAADCPFGKWTVRYHATTPQWRDAICSPNGRTCSRTEFDYDLGALLMYPLNNQAIQARVGSHVLRYNTQIAYHYTFGYPHGAPFTGRYLYVCIGNNIVGHGHLRQACSMTPGASGGPWLSNFNTGWRGYLNSVNSHIESTGYMDGPLQGRGAQLLFDFVRNR